MFTIYKATNKTNGHCYIGFDCKWPYRKSAHKTAVKRGSTLVFHNAIRSYGWDNFEWEILEQSDNRERMLNERESFYINKYLSHYLKGNGYNMTDGGEATFGWIPSDETKRKIGIANSRSTLTEEGRKIKSEYTKQNNPMDDPTIRAKHRLKALESGTNSRKVTNGIKTYRSIREAQKDVGTNYNTLYHWIANSKNGWKYA